jgi:hypothetical protein
MLSIRSGSADVRQITGPMKSAPLALAWWSKSLAAWRDGEGLAFDPAPGPDHRHRPGLQGTEMGLSIVWLLADLLGVADALGYRPRGVHRPEPAWPPAAGRP